MLRIRVLGELQLEADGARLAPPAGRPARALLGWLALHPGTHARATVAAALWPDVLDTSARASLRNALALLRAALGSAGAAEVIATREALGLAGEPGAWVDLRAFETLMDEGRHEQALELCRGELLAGLDDDWVLVARDEHRERRGVALGALADAAERRGERERGLAFARKRVSLDPLDELAHRDLVRRLAAAGDRAGALATYERFAERLRRQLGVAPSPETRELAAALRREAPSAAPAAPLPQPPLPAALVAVAGRGPLLGREAALGRLERQWAIVRSGATRLALLTGEPGIGKTRLAAELAAELHADGFPVLYGRADEEALVPYQPFVEALRETLSGPGAELPAETAELAGLVPELAARLPPRSAAGTGGGPGAHLRFFEAVAAALDAVTGRRPSLFVLDDLHWADRPTLRLLVRYLRRPRRAPALVLAAYREAEVDGRDAFAETLSELRRDHRVEPVALAGLDAGAIEAIVTRTTGRVAEAGVVRALGEQTGGNPFFLEELLRDLGERELARLPHGGARPPEGATQVVAARVNRLGPEAAAVLTAAAVAGPEFDLELVAEVVGLPSDAALDLLDAAVRARIIVEVEGKPGRYAFVHALSRDALTGALSAARQARLHDLTATALERRAEDDPDRYLVALAHHALGAAPAGGAERAVELAERAARRLAAVHGHDEAARLLERALGAVESGDASRRRRAQLLCALGEALQPAGDSEQARAAFDRASELARELGDAQLLGRAALGAGGLGITIREVDLALVERLQEALAALGNDDRELRARLLGRLSIELAYAPDRGRAERASREAVALARRLDQPAVLASALNARHVALWAPDRTRARLDCATEMLELARRAGDRSLALQARNWRVLDLFELGDGTGVRAELDAYAALAAEVRLPPYSWYVPLWRATVAVLEGRSEEATVLARRACKLGRQAGDANADVFWQELQHTRMLAEERYGDGSMLEYMERRAERSPAGLAYRATLAWHLAESDREREARDHLDLVAADGFAQVPRDMNWLPTMASATQACARLGDAGRGRELRRLLEPYAQLIVVSGRASGHYGSVAFLLARLAGTVGDPDAADALFTEAERRDERAGARVWVIRDLRRHGELLLALGETERAHALLDRAEREAGRTGPVPTLATTGPDRPARPEQASPASTHPQGLGRNR